MPTSYFDKDGSGNISPIEIESALTLLNYPGHNGIDVRAAVAAVPANAPAHDPLTFADFCRAFVYCLSALDSATWTQLRFAFASFDEDGNGEISLPEFHGALERMAPAPISDLAVQSVFDELDADASGNVDIDEWLDFCRRRYAMSVFDAQGLSGELSAPLLPPLPQTDVPTSSS